MVLRGSLATVTSMREGSLRILVFPPVTTLNKVIKKKADTAGSVLGKSLQGPEEMFSSDLVTQKSTVLPDSRIRSVVLSSAPIDYSVAGDEGDGGVKPQA